MQRRDVLRSLGYAAAVSLLPRDAEAAWAVVARRRGETGVSAALGSARAATAAALADAIIPRTDTPGAVDVGVVEFVDVFVAGWFTVPERAAFERGLDDIDALARSIGGAPLAELTGEPREAVMRALDQPADRGTRAARTYLRLKGLVVHGFFTSERVQKEVLKVEVMPGRWDGAAPLAVRPASRGRPNG